MHQCRYCRKACIKKGVRNTVQKYQCKECGKYQQSEYTYRVLSVEKLQEITCLTKEGLGISSISRTVNLSKSMVQRSLFRAGNALKKPLLGESGGDYELDEMTLTIAGHKDVYLIYSINRDTRQVVDFFIGNRTKENIRRVVDTVLSYDPRRVFTDGLNSYPSLIPKDIHRPGRRLTNRIERKNLTFRTLVWRLSRNTLCFSRKLDMLNAVMNLVFWS